MVVYNILMTVLIMAIVGFWFWIKKYEKQYYQNLKSNSTKIRYSMELEAEVKQTKNGFIAILINNKKVCAKGKTIKDALIKLGDVINDDLQYHLFQN